MFHRKLGDAMFLRVGSHIVGVGFREPDLKRLVQLVDHRRGVSNVISHRSAAFRYREYRPRTNDLGVDVVDTKVATPNFYIVGSTQFC